MNTTVIVGLIIAIGGIVGLSVYTGFAGKKSKKDGLSAPVAVGLLMGTVVGGSSTIGTAQLAFTYGLSAWWFTLGVGIGCLILIALFYEPIKNSSAATLVGVVSLKYGSRAGRTASILNSCGMFINILSQLLSCSAVILTVFPESPNVLGMCLGAVVMLCYVIFGGTKGAGVVGILKTVLLYSSMAVCGFIALRYMGGASGTAGLIKDLIEETGRNYGSLFCRGLGTDLGAALSLVLGLITTQTYIQALLAAKDRKTARISGYAAAVLAPLLGIFGILVGLYMRSAVPDPAAFNTKTALTVFILEYSGIPDLLAGVALGTLFIASVGTGAGLVLGISTVVDRELVRKERSCQRPIMAAVLCLAIAVSSLPIGDMILKFAFMSMGLRGCTVFAPLCFAIWCRKKAEEKYVLVSIVSASLVTLILGVLNMASVIALPCDAVFFGIALGLGIMAFGSAKGKPCV